MSRRWGAYAREQRFAWLIVLALAAAVLVLASSRSGAPAAAEQLAVSRELRAAQSAALSEEAQPVESFAFDPNTVTGKQLLRLGLSERQARSWLRFRGDRKRPFRRAEDIGKLYALTPDQKSRLIALARVAPPADRPQRQAESFPFDPNTVGKADLQRLGLSFRQAEVFQDFREAARYQPAFRNTDDLRRFGAASPEQIAHLVNNAVFPENTRSPKPTAQRFPFDPNRISADSLQLLGFPRWQAESLLKYRAGRPATFRRPEDLLRVRSLDSQLVQDLLPLVRISAAVAGSLRKYPPRRPPPALASFDVNTSDTTAWQTLPGIGSYRALRIVRFRKALGGFATLDQIGTTRGLPDSIFRQIQPYLKLSPLIHRLAVNQADERTLSRHPYVTRKLATAIVRYREQHGPYTSAADLSNIRLLRPDNLDQLRPYLDFE